uniref:Zinc finger and BTB domain-containing protein 40-like isoform X2 n=1 Tax=Diabrotica virgifera virgifera TaxID=50390 RepID=A0A6P7GEG7_DIAVI
MLSSGEKEFIKCRLNCRCRFSTDDLRQRHKKERHYRCAYCEISFLKIEDRNHHQTQERDHHEREVHEPFKCYHCDSFYSENWHMRQHIEDKHDLKCQYCDDSFESFEEQNIHDISVHLTIKCPYCDRLFREDKQLQQHVNIEHYLECRYCDETFLYNRERSFHERCIHLTIECPHCDTLFSEEKDLEKHNPLCKNLYAIIGNRSGNRRNLNYFKCPNCVRLLNSDLELDTHIRNKHHFQCPYCNKSFKSSEEVHSHDSDVHLTIKCPQCESLFRSNELLRRHIKLKHNFECLYCDESFKSLQETEAHDRSVHLTNACPDRQRLFREDFLLDKHVKLKHKRKGETGETQKPDLSFPLVEVAK